MDEDVLEKAEQHDLHAWEGKERDVLVLNYTMAFHWRRAPSLPGRDSGDWEPSLTPRVAIDDRVTPSSFHAIRSRMRHAHLNEPPRSLPLGGTPEVRHDLEEAHHRGRLRRRVGRTNHQFATAGNDPARNRPRFSTTVDVVPLNLLKPLPVT